MLSSFRGASIFLALASCLFHQTVVAETINGNTAADMCSSLNTASSGNGNYSMYQTQGLCTNWCREEDSSNAYAIVQYQYCWCSTVAPGSDSIVDNSDCNTQCPGYTEWCGSKSDHLYGYMEIGPLPVSTMDASTSSTSTSSSTSSTTSSTSTSSSTSEPTTTTTTSSRTQSTSVQTTTDSAGVIMTVTTIATAAPESTGKGGGGSNTGMIVGVTVGISAALVMAIAGLFWYKWRRRNEAMESESKIGFRDSSGKGIESGFASPGRRDSRMMPMDPRMEDPYSAAFRRESQDSIGTLRDEQDYSRRVHQPQPRVLRAVNPDPENE
ncbi:putative ER membrane protein Wsc4 [Ceratocystis lukuohia]|uniref:ER membrane protein Wsc4 n=1 Tax=Ceratocystis lukuohia TaxID=2019550 RepID=A0ABR4MTF5_9PEZI